MLAESPKGDRLMNQLSAAVEEDAFPGALSSPMTIASSCSKGLPPNPQGGPRRGLGEAFDRLVRERVKHGETEELRALCLGIPAGFKPLQLPVGQALLSLQLESGEDFEATAEAFWRHCDPANPADEGTHELKGLAVAYPRFREFLDKLDVPELELDESRLRGKRLVVIGGHEWLRKCAMPKFDAWGVKTTWLDPDSAKNGQQAPDLAAGGADLIVINTACISHAASGRVRQARNPDVRYAFHNSRGVGALLSIAREALADSEPPIQEAKSTKHDVRRKLLR